MVAERPTAIQAMIRGFHGRRRSVSQATRKVRKLRAMPPPISSFQRGKLEMLTPGGYFTTRLTASNRPQ